MMQPPPPPDALDDIGRTEWTRVVGLLVERGHWDPLRSTVLLAYCESYADWHRLTAQVRGREVVLQGGTRRVDDQGHVTTEGGKAAPNPLFEPYRVYRRAFSLRGWSHVTTESVFPRSTRASGAAGPRARG